MEKEFRLNRVHETRNNLFKEISRNEMMTEKYKKVLTTLNYIEYLINFTFYILDVFPFLVLLL